MWFAHKSSSKVATLRGRRTTRHSLRRIDTDCRRLGAFSSDSDKQLAQIRRKETRARSLYRGDLGNFFIVIGIFLLVDGNAALTTRRINSLASDVIEDVVRITDYW